jgi:hypothetical protein
MKIMPSLSLHQYLPPTQTSWKSVEITALAIKSIPWLQSSSIAKSTSSIDRQLTKQREKSRLRRVRGVPFWTFSLILRLCLVNSLAFCLGTINYTRLWDPAGLAVSIINL